MPENEHSKAGTFKASRGFFEIEDVAQEGDKRPHKRGFDLTSTIAKRKVEVYFKTLEDKRNIKKIAKDKGVSASEYILHCVHMMGGTSQVPSSQELQGLKRRLATVETERDTLRQENLQLKETIKHYDSEIAILRTREIPIPDHLTENGISQIDPHLVEVLQAVEDIDGAVEGSLLFKLVGIKSTDQVAVKKLRHDLEVLQSYGLIEPTLEGWKWVR